mgnify:CR=1 FL=1
MKRWLVCAVLGAVFVGCVAIDLKTKAEPDELTKVSKEFYQNAYTGNWWGENPQAVLSEKLQRPDGTIDDRGLSKVFVTQTWWQTVKTIGSFGFRVPVYITWWEER